MSQMRRRLNNHSKVKNIALKISARIFVLSFVTLFLVSCYSYQRYKTISTDEGVYIVDKKRGESYKVSENDAP